MKTIDLTGADLHYWVARANDSSDPNILRRHYGAGHGDNDPSDEPSMRQFVADKLGCDLPPRKAWQ